MNAHVPQIGSCNAKLLIHPLLSNGEGKHREKIDVILLVLASYANPLLEANPFTIYRSQGPFIGGNAERTSSSTKESFAQTISSGSMVNDYSFSKLFRVCHIRSKVIHSSDKGVNHFAY